MCHFFSSYFKCFLLWQTRIFFLFWFYLSFKEKKKLFFFFLYTSLFFLGGREVAFKNIKVFFFFCFFTFLKINPKKFFVHFGLFYASGVMYILADNSLLICKNFSLYLSFLIYNIKRNKEHVSVLSKHKLSYYFLHCSCFFPF